MKCHGNSFTPFSVMLLGSRIGKNTLTYAKFSKLLPVWYTAYPENVTKPHSSVLLSVPNRHEFPLKKYKNPVSKRLNRTSQECSRLFHIMSDLSCIFPKMCVSVFCKVASRQEKRMRQFRIFEIENSVRGPPCRDMILENEPCSWKIEIEYMLLGSTSPLKIQIIANWPRKFGMNVCHIIYVNIITRF